MKLKRSKSRPSHITRRLIGPVSGSALLVAVACGGTSDPTAIDLEDELGMEGSSPTPPANSIPREPSTDSAELERLLLENEARAAQWRREAAAIYAALTDEELAALAGRTSPSAEQMEAEWEAAKSAALSAEEESAVRALLESAGERLHFVGRTVMQGDVLYHVDELLRPSGTSTVEKADLPTGVETEPFPGSTDPSRPTAFASKNSQVWFWRPDTSRRYYVVVPDAVPLPYFDALVFATGDIMSALSDDCLDGTFVTYRQSTYNQLSQFEKDLSSVIQVAYSNDACGNEADGCARSPHTATLMLSPIDWQNRLRLGTFIGFEPDYDRDDDEDTVPDLTEANARYVALHELTHTLGFSHPGFPEFNPAGLVGSRARIPTTAEGTVPSIMFPTDEPRSSTVVTADDKQALRKAYSGQCAYQGAFRSLGQTCSTTDEDNCLRHGGACEVNAGAGVCRWAHYKDSASCFRYSYGTWTASGASVLPGEPGACVAPAASLLPELSGSTRTEPQDYAGRRCRQGSGAPGVFFNAFSSAFATTFYCSDQKDVWDPDDWDNWEFNDTTEVEDFVESNPSWQMSSGNYTNWDNEGANWTIAKESMTYGCISTKVTTTDDGASGIIFDYIDDENFYYFELQPNLRRRIRRMGRLPNGTVVNQVLSSVSLNYAATWSPGITLTVCYGDGIHTFIDNGSRVSVTSAVDTFDNDRDGNTTEALPVSIPNSRRFGLFNSFNQAGRHAYLRTFPLVQGFALAQ